MPFYVKSIGFVLAYLVAAKVGLMFGTVNSSATIFWPAGGIALGIVLLGGARYLPLVFAGALLAAAMINAPPIFAVGSALGNTLETFIAFTLLKRFGSFNFHLDRTRDFFGLIALGAMIPAIAGAVIGPASLMASGSINADMLPEVMWRWWRADVMGITFFTPLVLLFASSRPIFPGATPAKLVESLFLLVISIVVGQVILLGWRPLGLSFDPAPQLSWLFALVIWAGLRAGRRQTALIQHIFLLQAIVSAYLNTGYFADDFALYGLTNFWIFAMVLAVGGTALAIQTNAQRNALEQAKHHAQYDFLTKLPNRLLFADRFTHQMAFATRHGKKFAIIHLDLDKFKPVNDTFGHQVGDELLIAVADRLSELTRDIDTVSRFGGDEFVILVSEVNSEGDVISLALKILKALNEPFIISGHSIQVSGSLGIALYPDHGKTLNSILHNADLAMYRAKNQGSGTYSIAEA